MSIQNDTKKHRRTRWTHRRTRKTHRRKRKTRKKLCGAKQLLSCSAHHGRSSCFQSVHWSSPPFCTKAYQQLLRFLTGSSWYSSATSWPNSFVDFLELAGSDDDRLEQAEGARRLVGVSRFRPSTSHEVPSAHPSLRVQTSKSAASFRARR